MKKEGVSDEGKIFGEEDVRALQGDTPQGRCADYLYTQSTAQAAAEVACLALKETGER